MARPRRFDWLFRPQLAAEDMPLSAETRFAEALADLPAVERSALALSEIGGLDAEEIAERLGTEPAIVRKVLERARESVRTTIALRGRRGLMTLLPFQSWWQSGSSAPAFRAAGAVAAAVVGTGVAIGGASADGPRHPLTNPDPPAISAPETAPVREARANAASPGVAGAVPAVSAATRGRASGTPATAGAQSEPPPGRPAPPLESPAPPLGSPAPPHALPEEPAVGTPAAPPEAPAAGEPDTTAPPDVTDAVPMPTPVDVAIPPVPVPVPLPPVVVPPVAVDPALPSVPLP